MGRVRVVIAWVRVVSMRVYCHGSWSMLDLEVRMLGLCLVRILDGIK